MIYSYKQNNHNYIFYLNRDTTKHHKYWILLYLKQNIPKKIEEILLNLNQLHRRWGRTTGLLFNIFVKFISLTSINIVLQTVAGNYKKYNFFLDFFSRIWYNIFEDKENCNESFRLKSRIASFKQDIAKQKRKLIWQSIQQLHESLAWAGRGVQYALP